MKRDVITTLQPPERRRARPKPSQFSQMQLPKYYEGYPFKKPDMKKLENNPNKLEISTALLLRFRKKAIDNMVTEMHIDYNYKYKNKMTDDMAGENALKLMARKK
jgi:hypothetical protein